MAGTDTEQATTEQTAELAATPAPVWEAESDGDDVIEPDPAAEATTGTDNGETAGEGEAAEATNAGDGEADKPKHDWNVAEQKNAQRLTTLERNIDGLKDSLGQITELLTKQQQPSATQTPQANEQQQEAAAEAAEDLLSDLDEAIEGDDEDLMTRAEARALQARVKSTVQKVTKALGNSEAGKLIKKLEGKVDQLDQQLQQANQQAQQANAQARESAQWASVQSQHGLKADEMPTVKAKWLEIQDQVIQDHPTMDASDPEHRGYLKKDAIDRFNAWIAKHKADSAEAGKPGKTTPPASKNPPTSTKGTQTQPQGASTQPSSAGRKTLPPVFAPD